MSLEQFAGVRTAVALGIELDAVLAQEGVDSASWTVAERQWREALVGSTSLQVELMRVERVAQDTLSRRLDPLDEDPAAWVGLLGTLALATEPGAVLERLGVAASELDRLGRVWRKRAAEDASLAARMEELAASAPAPERINASPLELRPFPWTRGAAAAPPVAAVASSTTRLGAKAPDPDGPPKRVLASFQLSRPVLAAPPAAPRPAIDATLPVGEVKVEPLPFRPAAPMAPVATAIELSESAGRTVGLDREPSPNATLPFDADGLRLLKLEHYAKLVAELRSAPEHAEAIMGEVGLAQLEQRRRIHQLWMMRFDASPDLRQRFESLVDKLRKERR